jgi:hypothetical protein
MPFIPLPVVASNGQPRPIDLPAFRTDRDQVDLALVAAANILRTKLEEETGDELALEIALRVLAPTIATFTAALSAQQQVGQ